MKALLVAVNAKYIHTSLSVRTLKAYANSDNVEMAEYTINERVEDILRSIFLKKADVVLFSCYIWNVEVCLDVADMLKKVSAAGLSMKSDVYVCDMMSYVMQEGGDCYAVKYAIRVE